jgi:hypothetical protein
MTGMMKGLLTGLLQLSAHELARQILIAADKKDTAKIIRLRRENPDVDVKGHIDSGDAGGWTGLMEATRTDHVDIVAQLLELGADVNAARRHHLVCNGRPAPDSRQPVNGALVSGDTPLMVAARFNSLECAKRLLEAGANPCLRNVNHKTALDFLQETSSPDTHREEIARELIPRMFDLMWWRGKKTPADLKAAWADVPEQWRKFAAETMPVLSRHYAHSAPASPQSPGRSSVRRPATLS